MLMFSAEKLGLFNWFQIQWKFVSSVSLKKPCLPHTYIGDALTHSCVSCRFDMYMTSRPYLGWRDDSDGR